MSEPINIFTDLVIIDSTKKLHDQFNDFKNILLNGDVDVDFCIKRYERGIGNGQPFSITKFETYDDEMIYRFCVTLYIDDDTKLDVSIDYDIRKFTARFFITPSLYNLLIDLKIAMRYDMTKYAIVRPETNYGDFYFNQLIKYGDLTYGDIILIEATRI